MQILGSEVMMTYLYTSVYSYVLYFRSLTYVFLTNTQANVIENNGI